MKITTYSESVFTHAGVPQFLDHWRNFSVYTGIPTKTYSYIELPGVKKSLIRLSKNAPKRDTYYSLEALLRLQVMVQMLVSGYYYKLERNEVIQSYIKGRSPYDYIREHMVGCKLLMACDIKGYFDSVTHQDIFDSMKKLGFPNQGAKTIANITTMKKKFGRHQRQVLQQGSKASPAISNFVGYHQIDPYILDWLNEYQKKHTKLIYKYMRYCDNIFCTFDGEVPLLEVRKDFTQAVMEIVGKHGRKTHKWEWTLKNDPKRHQRILGVIVNEKMRIDRHKFKAMRGLVFNLATRGVEETLQQFFQSTGIQLPPSMVITPRNLEKIFYQKVQGSIAFTKKVNAEQYKVLTKLFKAGKFLNRFYAVLGKQHLTDVDYADSEGKLHPALFDAVKKYGDNEGIDPYMKRIADIADLLEASHNQFIKEEIVCPK